MVRVTAILLALSLLLQCGARYGMLGLYRLNKAYIAANLCENRAQPGSGCQGKCYLKKQLARVDETGKPYGQGVAKKDAGQILLYFEAPACHLPDRGVPSEARRRTPVMQRMHDTRTTAAVYHPPA